MSEKRKVMNLEIDDQAFALLKVQINNALKGVVTSMRDHGSDEGTVTVKIALSTEEAAVPDKGDYVEKLSVDWKLTVQIPLKSQTDGGIYDADQYYLDFDENGKPYMQRIQQAQHEIDEYL